MQLFLQQSVNGLLLGGMFALISIGLSLMFGIMKVANFAYGALYMLGGYAAFWASNLLGVPNWVAILVAFAAAFMMGALMEGLGFAKFRGNEEATLIFGLGVALIARGGAVLESDAPVLSVTSSAERPSPAACRRRAAAADPRPRRRASRRSSPCAPS